METVLWAMVVKSLRSLQTFWQIRFFSSNPADYRCTQGCWLAALCFAALRSYFCIDLFCRRICHRAGLQETHQARVEGREGQSASRLLELHRWRRRRRAFQRDTMGSQGFGTALWARFAIAGLDALLSASHCGDFLSVLTVRPKFTAARPN